jgi:hypothetical protein
MSESQDTTEQSPTRENGGSIDESSTKIRNITHSRTVKLALAPFELVDKVKEKKLTESEVQAIANRINHLELEEQRVRKSIAGAKKKTQSMLEAKKRNEDDMKVKLKHQKKLQTLEEQRREQFNHDRKLRKKTIEQSKTTVAITNKNKRGVCQSETDVYKKSVLKFKEEVKNQKLNENKRVQDIRRNKDEKLQKMEDTKIFNAQTFYKERVDNNSKPHYRF